MKSNFGTIKANKVIMHTRLKSEVSSYGNSTLNSRRQSMSGIKVGVRRIVAKRVNNYDQNTEHLIPNTRHL